MRALILHLLLLLPVLLARPAAAQSTPPSKPDSALTITSQSCKWVKLKWKRGTGQYHLVVLTDNYTGTMAPTNGTAYTGNTYYAAGSFVQNNGYAVYAGTDTVATVRSLRKDQPYLGLVYAYNLDGNGDPVYQQRVPDTLRFTTGSCPNVSPTRVASRLRATTIDCSTFRLTCHPGNGQQRLFVMRKSSQATVNTSAGEVGVDQDDFYPASNLYARGFEMRPGLFAIYAGTDSTVVVYGLAPDQIYKCAVYEFNTVPDPDGLPDGATPSYTQYNYPIFWPATGGCSGEEPIKSIYDDMQHQTSNARVVAGSLTTNQVTIQWHPSMTPGRYVPGQGGVAVYLPPGRTADDGVGNYVVIRNATLYNQLPLPVQNTVPGVCSTIYGQGAPVRPGMDSIFSVKLTQAWNDTSVTITGLKAAHVYTVDVFTFRYPTAASGGGVAPYTYFLSLPQATVSFATPFTPSGPLPVQLTRFVAVRHGAKVELQWTTASELNNLGFRIERSSDGVNWVARDFITGAGTSTQSHSYSYAEPYAPAAYYRLAQLDLNQKLTYSPVRYVDGYNGVDALGLYPNPASLETTLTGTDPAQPVDVYDLRGRLVLHAPAPASTLSLLTFPPGLYLVRQGARVVRLMVR